MEYILFIHNNVDSPASDEQWVAFFAVANASGIFSGGSEINNGIQLGSKPIRPTTQSVDGFMRFETDDVDQLYRLLQQHPILLQGGTLELCQMPRTE